MREVEIDLVKISLPLFTLQRARYLNLSISILSNSSTNAFSSLLILFGMVFNFNVLIPSYVGIPHLEPALP